jgi:hypothetical protein
MGTQLTDEQGENMATEGEDRDGGVRDCNSSIASRGRNETLGPLLRANCCHVTDSSQLKRSARLQRVHFGPDLNAFEQAHNRGSATNTTWAAPSIQDDSGRECSSGVLI